VNVFDTTEKVAERASAGTQNASASTEKQLASMDEIASSIITLSEMAESLQTLLNDSSSRAPIGVIFSHYI
jgi:methyl-accepting chemotaxis protein